jgi:hypothetical protein
MLRSNWIMCAPPSLFGCSVIRRSPVPRLAINECSSRDNDRGKENAGPEYHSQDSTLIRSNPEYPARRPARLYHRTNWFHVVVSIWRLAKKATRRESESICFYLPLCSVHADLLPRLLSATNQHAGSPFKYYKIACVSRQWYRTAN